MEAVAASCIAKDNLCIISDLEGAAEWLMKGIKFVNVCVANAKNGTPLGKA